MSRFNLIRIYDRISAGRLLQAALAVIVCLTMILSSVAPALADDGGETPAPVEGGQEAPPPVEGSPPPLEGEAGDSDTPPPPGDEKAPPPDDDQGNTIQANTDSVLVSQQDIHVEDKINLASGAATYLYPIATPPGAGGMGPNLALAYNSQVEWGILGHGWSIAGLDMIHRSTKNGAPQYDSSDTFVLGGEDLIFHDGYYHTEHENYMRIQHYGDFGSDSGWVVTSKNGTQYRFGHTSDSRIEAVGKGGQVRVWMLNQVLDTNGNYMTISYTEDTTNGDFYPDTITYAYNDAGGISAYHTVEFYWEARTDARSSYAQGALVNLDQRLASIEVQSVRRQPAAQVRVGLQHGQRRQVAAVEDHRVRHEWQHLPASKDI